MHLRVAVLGVLGGLLTGAVAVLVFAPGLLLGTALARAAVRIVSGLDPNTVSIWTALAVLAALAVVSWSPTGSGYAPGTKAETAFERALADTPEAVTDDRRQVAAADLDSDLALAVFEGGEPFAEVREALFRTAVGVYAAYERADLETRSYAAVAGGEWTDDRTAAAFLAEEDGPTPTLLARVRLWLTPERERRRRVDRTLAAIRHLREEEP
jgi:hypothetical protein